MDSDESYGNHNESEFYYPDEMTNGNEKENISVISNEENQQNVDVFTTANVQNYILAQRKTQLKNKKTEYDLNVWKRFPRSISENREIEEIPADELNILICRFMMDMEL